MIQSWVPAFNPTLPVGLKLTTWVTLKQLSLEYASSVHWIAQGLGEVLGWIKWTNLLNFLGFVWPWMWSKDGWVLFPSNPLILVAKLLSWLITKMRQIPCRYCLDTTHCVRDCLELLQKCRPGYSRAWSPWRKQRACQEEPAQEPAPRQLELRSKGRWHKPILYRGLETSKAISKPAKGKQVVVTLNCDERWI